jgi:hypothetical protein
MTPLSTTPQVVLCVDGKHVADRTLPLREREIDFKAFHGRYSTHLC